MKQTSNSDAKNCKKVDLEHDSIYYNQSRISVEDLTPGDELELILSDPQSGGPQKEIKSIIVIRGQKLGITVSRGIS